MFFDELVRVLPGIALKAPKIRIHSADPGRNRTDGLEKLALHDLCRDHNFET
jgi:hypothetical protein